MTADDSPLLSGMATLASHPNTAEELRRAALTVAGHARDVADCAELLDMLGLEVE